ncbi:MAG: HD domain-containing phosphohydrolase [Burkholderiaceae bacterium]|jgi:HD-GYP domain-containing protein (c-di-GMP phosphodiesterase class II)
MSHSSDSFSRLDQLTEISRALAGERDLTKLLELILVSARAATGADGGTLYRVVEEGRALSFDLVMNSTLGLHFGGTSGRPANFAPMPLYDAAGRENLRSVVAYCALTRKSVLIDDAYTAQGFDFQGARHFDESNSYRSKSFLTVPMTSHDDQLIGVLQLINAQDNSGETVAFSIEDQGFIEALAAQAAIALDNKLLVDKLQELFLGFVNLINLAIDEKSPYTGGHCQRVPELTMMLAEAASATQAGPLAEFRMSDRDRQELMMAGLLHDCGKITTPVHVVDKSTKLQTIFDRIELVETRLTAYARELEFNAAQAKLSCATASHPAIDQRLREELQELEDDRAFLGRVNIGGERMAAEDIARVERIGQRSWTAPDGTRAPLLSAEEIANLTIPYGTLTAEERTIINNHIVATIRMLEALPWPPHLKNVPEYAGGHHERMDGKGYPRGLTREQMSVQARTMGIADVFEALTAKDRPYKEGKKLTESLQILGRMAQSGHVDPDLFDVFVRDKVYLQYAMRFLDPQQIDAVDESGIPGYTP